MKKVLVAVVLMMGIGSFSAFAAETSVDSVVIACEVNQDDFVKVEVKDLPGVVTQSIEKSYPDSVIQEVYVAEKTEGKLFKVILVIEGKEAIAIFNEKGEFLRMGMGQSSCLLKEGRRDEVVINE